MVDASANRPERASLQRAKRPTMETTPGLRLAVNTQTPLVRFYDEANPAPGLRTLAEFRELEDYKFTTGGVTRMLLPLLKRWRRGGFASGAAWVALAAGEATPRLDVDGVRLSFVKLPAEDRAGYAIAKERMWQLLNSYPSAPVPHGEGGIPEHAWVAFDRYQALSAAALLGEAREMGGADALYVHDFQQVGVGEAWQGHDIPKLFHLHTPFPSHLPAAWNEYFQARLRAFDAIIVSTRRYRDNLLAAGVDVPIHVMPPFIDPEDYAQATSADVDAFRDRFGIARSDRVVLNVGRMDPMKGQDRLLRAMPALLARVPEAKLLLVGNGSFSSSRKGGLGLDKGRQWRASLEALAKDLGVSDRVIFTGHLADHEIPLAYETCHAFALPSTREGFGLAVIEAWRHARPVVVSDRCGVAELIDGSNGVSLDAGQPRLLANTLAELLLDADRAAAMGQQGFRDSAQATMPHGRATLERILMDIMEAPRHVAA